MFNWGGYRKPQFKNYHDEIIAAIRRQEPDAAYFWVIELCKHLKKLE